MNALWFLVVLFTLFGPKLGLLDLTVAGGLLGLILISLQRRVVVPGEYLTLLIMAIALAGYAVIVVLFTGADDYYIILRQMRAALALGLLGVVFFNARIGSAALLNILILALLLNAVAIAVQIVFPDSRLYFAEIWEFNKTFAPLQAFGLTAGLDPAGYLCLIGAFLSLAAMLYRPRQMRYLVGFTVFSIAALFTSRNNILLALSLMFLVGTGFVFKGKAVYKLVGAAYLSVGAYVVVMFVIPLFVATVPLLEFLEVDSDVDRTYFTYSRGTIEEWSTTFWLAPTELTGVIFGTGVNPSVSDIGYVKLLYMVGIIGLSLALMPYLYLFGKGIRLRRIAIAVPNGGDRWATNSLALAFLIMITFTFVINFKALYFFTRSFHELWVIVFFSLLAALSGRQVPRAPRAGSLGTLA